MAGCVLQSRLHGGLSLARDNPEEIKGWQPNHNHTKRVVTASPTCCMDIGSWPWRRRYATVPQPWAWLGGGGLHLEFLSGRGAALPAALTRARFSGWQALQFRCRLLHQTPATMRQAGRRKTPSLGLGPQGPQGTAGAA